MPLNEEDLLQRALNNEILSEEARQHLAQCPACQKHLAEYIKVNTFLLSLLYRSQCPSSTNLSFYSADLLPANEMDTIAAHLRICPLCATEAEVSSRFLTEVKV